MAIQFPASPTNGQVYQGYYYDSTLSAWKASPVSAGPVAIADAAPAGAIHGDMWYNSLDGSSYIYVNDGTSGQWVEVHSNTAAVPGSILQVLQTVKTNTFVSSSSSWVDVTGWSVTITPKLSTSKILVTANGYTSHTDQNGFAYLKLVRNGSDIFLGDSRGNATRASADAAQQVAGTVAVWAKPVAISFLDSPATTSATTYTVQVKNTVSTLTIGGTADTADGNRSNVPTTITVMEVAQ